MNFLIFCSAEIGGLPYHFAKTLNDSGLQTYFISLSGRKKGHDTISFHYGKEKKILGFIQRILPFKFFTS